MPCHPPSGTFPFTPFDIAELAGAELCWGSLDFPLSWVLSEICEVPLIPFGRWSLSWFVYELLLLPWSMMTPGMLPDPRSSCGLSTPFTSPPTAPASAFIRSVDSILADVSRGGEDCDSRRAQRAEPALSSRAKGHRRDQSSTTDTGECYVRQGYRDGQIVRATLCSRVRMRS